MSQPKKYNILNCANYHIDTSHLENLHFLTLLFAHVRFL